MPIDLIEARETCHIGLPAAVQPLPPGVTPGAGVTVRGGRWQLDAVVAHADCRELHLRGGDPPARRVLLWPFDRPVAADGCARSPRLRSVGLWAWASAVGAAVADAQEPLTPPPRAGAARLPPLQPPPAVAMAGGVPPGLLAPP